jgi:hypothetical protein
MSGKKSNDGIGGSHLPKETRPPSPSFWNFDAKRRKIRSRG